MAMLKSVADHFQDIKNLLQQKRWAEAQPILDDILARYPRDPELLFMAGTCRIVQGHHGPGIVLLERALDLGYQKIDCLMNVANAYAAEGDMATAELYCAMAHQRNEPSANLYANTANIRMNQGLIQESIDLCNTALQHDPSSTLAKFNRSIGYLHQGRWAEGFRDYHRFSGFHGERSKRKYDLPNRPCPEWDGTPNQTVVVWGEQGLGDELMFASCIPDLIAVSKEVVIECDPRLEPLFRRSFPTAIVYGTTDQEKTGWPWHHSIDASIAMGGLPQFFRKETQDFPRTPFLKADEWQINRWKEKLAELGPEPKVLISWLGGLKKTKIEQRSVPLSFWKPILSGPYKFISLQWHEEAEAEADAYGVKTYHEAIQSFDFGASLMEACDLVVSVTNTNAHLAGGLGKRCLCLVPEKPAWPFAGESNVWYRSVEHINQQGDWSTSIERVAGDLQKMLWKEAAE